MEHKKRNIICGLCNKEISSYSFIKHLKSQHNMSSDEKERNIFLKKYYDSYVEPDTEHLCPVCGKQTQWVFQNGDCYGHYKKFCSRSCSTTYMNKTIQQQWEELHPGEKRKIGLNCPSAKDRIRQTCLERYGFENVAQSDIIKKKVRQTNYRKYGKWFSQTKEYKEKVKRTCIRKYGVDSHNKTDCHKESYKQTCLEKYGVDSYSKTDNYKEKIKQTCLERYGVDNVTKLKEVQDKIYKTKKKNNSFNSSKLEERFYEVLCSLYDEENIVRQYQDERYKNPYNGHLFNCDFYIKSLDLFIEIQGDYSHGPKPYSNEAEDSSVLEAMNEKAKYSAAPSHNPVYLYTEYDVLKRSVARYNKLNYLEVFNRHINSYNKENISNLINNSVRKQNVFWASDESVSYYSESMKFICPDIKAVS